MLLSPLHTFFGETMKFQAAKDILRQSILSVPSALVARAAILKEAAFEIFCSCRWISMGRYQGWLSLREARPSVTDSTTQKVASEQNTETGTPTVHFKYLTE